MMKEEIISLSQKARNNIFFKNKIELRCNCGHSEKITYYEFLTGGEFNIGQATSTVSPFISETIYDETISVTPLYLSKRCATCDEELTVVFPIALEALILILRSNPPDPQMYG
ncbi:hypothetical protein [Candidatus Methanoperedens nitratireducens]|nr:hypothetical protein [Candidatus Methanoperedens nitroreducens]